MRVFISILLLMVFFSCQNSKKNDTEVKGELVYDMYKPSEMAILMNDMYAYNLKLKQEIIDGKVPTEFPSGFLNIHTAEMSEFKSRNETFQAYSQLFIEHQNEVFNIESPKSIKDRFNSSVQVCVSCHTTECTGPIPKIKKLFIK